MKFKKIVVIIPTYNEAENIAKLLESVLLQQSSLLNASLHVLIIDDSSPDGTADVVREYQKYNKTIHLISGRKKQGLGAAYIYGFTFALRELNADVLIEMDADFSHDPNDIPRLISKIEEDYDFVIGSRYIAQGSIPSNWGIVRKLNSKIGNLFATKVAGLKNINDCTGGFRAIKAEILKKINLKRLNVKGYAFQISLLHEALKKGARVREIPIEFKDRVKGKSKIRLDDVVEFILNSFLLRFPSARYLPDMLLGISIGLFVSLVLFLVHVSIGISLNFLLVLFSSLMILQGLYTLYWMIYAWDHPDRVNENKSPTTFIRPSLSFSAIVPAKNEEKVITHTIESLSRIDYPEELKEVVVVCKSDDINTITHAQRAIDRIGKSNIRLIVFDDNIASKPHALNFGLHNTTKDVVVVFDAEDDPHSDIYNVANTVIRERDVDVLQSGVQLMNFNSTWFSSLNVLEYFFWFKSTLQYFASSGIVPLGGNTVFFKRKWLEELNGWDETCLTEDADIGIRLSLKGAKMKIVYDEVHVTKEESPLTLADFIRQRTRWNQGFLQVFQKGYWYELPSLKLKFLSLYILVSPILQALFFLFIPFSIYVIMFFKIPVGIALLTLIPFYILIIQLVTYNIGMYLFTKDYGIKYPLLMPLKILFTFFPFQVILGYSAASAVLRMFRKNFEWQKTTHSNIHREDSVSFPLGGAYAQ